MSSGGRNLGWQRFAGLRATPLAAAMLVIVGTPAFGQPAKNGGRKAETTSHTYGIGGRLLEEIHEYDFDGDGQVDGIQTTTFTYDQRGRVASKHMKSGPEADGCPQEKTTFRYDENSGVLTQELMERDDDCDGDADLKTVTDLQFDDDMLMKKVVRTYSGNSPTPQHRDEHVFTYSKEGKRLSETKQSYGSGGELSGKSVSEFQFDGNNLTEKKNAYYDAASKAVVRRETTFFKYDSAGTLLSERTEVDADADGKIDFASAGTHQRVHEIKGQYRRIWTVLGNVLLVAILLFFVLRKRAAGAV